MIDAGFVADADQTIFANNTYSKPYFVTYVNTASFSCFLLILPLKKLFVRYVLSRKYSDLARYVHIHTSAIDDDGHEQEAISKPNGDNEHEQDASRDCPDELPESTLSDEATFLSAAPQDDRLNIQEIAKLSLEFCVLWFVANYSLAAGLEYTTVASSTILLSTSSIWTLVFGALIGVENFKLRKLLGVMGSLAGVTLISAVDLSGRTDKNRGSFPHKSGPEIAIGDSLSLGSAVIYGIYTILMKKRVGNESRVNMVLFFGFVGVFNTVLLWPGLIMLHFTGLETFELPPDGHVWRIILVSVICMFSSLDL